MNAKNHPFCSGHPPRALWCLLGRPGSLHGFKRALAAHQRQCVWPCNSLAEFSESMKATLAFLVLRR